MRTFNDMSSITQCFESKTSPLVKIDVDRNISYYKTKNEKLSALKTRNSTDKFIIAWGGKYSSDVFEVSENDIQDVLITY